VWEVIAAVAALAAVAVGVATFVADWNWRRPVLSVNFSGISPTDRWIVFGLQLRNDGDRTIHDVHAVALLDGESVAEQHPGPVAERTALGPAILPRNQGIAGRSRCLGQNSLSSVWTS
jgi:hypothetical protein